MSNAFTTIQTFGTIRTFSMSVEFLHLSQCVVCGADILYTQKDFKPCLAPATRRICYFFFASLLFILCCSAGHRNPLGDSRLGSIASDQLSAAAAARQAVTAASQWIHGRPSGGQMAAVKEYGGEAAGRAASPGRSSGWYK